jgi:hypothetical protein
MRMRLNMANWEKGTTFEIDSRGQSQFVPTPEGREYIAYFVPTGEHRSLSDFARQFFASLDLLSFDPRLAPNARLKLEDLSIRPIDLSAVQPVRTLLEDDLSDAPGSWQYGSAPEAFTSALYGAEPGAISLAPGGEDSFGYWTLRTGVKAEAGKVYRARFLVRANTGNASGIPPFRLRLNSSRFELTSTSMIYPSDQLLEVPGTEARVYDVYLPVPADAIGDETILASIDLIAFGASIDQTAAITLENFLLEEVEIGE